LADMADHLIGENEELKGEIYMLNNHLS